MGLTARTATGRSRYRSTDPGGVWSRLEPRGKALGGGRKHRVRANSDTLLNKATAHIPDPVLIKHSNSAGLN